MSMKIAGARRVVVSLNGAAGAFAIWWGAFVAAVRGALMFG
jgi:hypothetical protein